MRVNSGLGGRPAAQRSAGPTLGHLPSLVAPHRRSGAQYPGQHDARWPAAWWMRVNSGTIMQGVHHGIGHGQGHRAARARQPPDANGLPRARYRGVVRRRRTDAGKVGRPIGGVWQACTRNEWTLSTPDMIVDVGVIGPFEEGYLREGVSDRTFNLDVKAVKDPDALQGIINGDKNGLFVLDPSSNPAPMDAACGAQQSLRAIRLTDEEAAGDARRQSWRHWKAAASSSVSRMARSDCCAPHAASIFAMAASPKIRSSGATLAATTSCTLPCGPSGTSTLPSASMPASTGAGLDEGSKTKRPFLSPLMMPCSASGSLTALTSRLKVRSLTPSRR